MYERMEIPFFALCNSTTAMLFCMYHRLSLLKRKTNIFTFNDFFFTLKYKYFAVLKQNTIDTYIFYFYAHFHHQLFTTTTTIDPYYFFFLAESSFFIIYLI